MQTKKFVIIVVAVIVLAGAVGGALFGGVAIGKNQSSSTGQFPGDMGQFPSGMGGGTMNGSMNPSGMGTTGTVSGISGDVITVVTSNDATVQVYTNSSTEIQEMATVSLSDITIGEDITVFGQSSQSGSVDATSIIIGSFQISAFRP
jgi:hypothetical protein